MNTVRLKTVLKSWFVTGAKPTESQFSDLITTLVANTPNAAGGDNAEDITVQAGNSAAAGRGGSISLIAGQSVAGTHGAVTLAHPSGAGITIGTDGRITISSPTGVIIRNSATGDSVSY